MDFESRDTLWASIVKSHDETADSSEPQCKLCLALEILKIAACPASCTDSKENLLHKLLPEVPPDCLDPHLAQIGSAPLVQKKISELETIILMQHQSYLSAIQALEIKVNTLLVKLDKLESQNKALKESLYISQAYTVDYTDRYVKYIDQIEFLKEKQREIMRFIDEINIKMDYNKELVLEMVSYGKLNDRVERIDNCVIEEYSKIDEMWSTLQGVRDSQIVLQSNQGLVKKYIQHCENIDKATETILSYHHQLLSLQTTIDSKLREMVKETKSEQIIGNTSEEYKNNVMELRKKTSECLLYSN